MFAGILNEPIEIWKFSRTTNAYGEVIETHNKSYGCRAKVSHISGARSVINSEIQYPYNKTFVIRYHIAVTDNDWIKYDDKYWRITGIDTDKELRQTIITTELVNE